MPLINTFLPLRICHSNLFNFTPAVRDYVLNPAHVATPYHVRGRVIHAAEGRVIIERSMGSVFRAASADIHGGPEDLLRSMAARQFDGKPATAGQSFAMSPQMRAQLRVAELSERVIVYDPPWQFRAEQPIDLFAMPRPLKPGEAHSTEFDYGDVYDGPVANFDEEFLVYSNRIEHVPVRR
jgi:hypothetical protein